MQDLYKAKVLERSETFCSVITYKKKGMLNIQSNRWILLTQNKLCKVTSTLFNKYESKHVLNIKDIKFIAINTADDTWKVYIGTHEHVLGGVNEDMLRSLKKS